MADKPGVGSARRATKAVSKAKKKSADREKKEQVIKMSTGVKLLCKKIPQYLYVDIINELNRDKPKVPTYYDEARGQMLENPDDEDYANKLRDWDIETGGAFTDALIIEGTEVYSLPNDKFPKHDDAMWLEKMRALHRPVDNPFTAYLLWVKYVAAPEAETDIGDIINHVGMLSGIREEDVDAALDSFRDQAARGADSGD